MILSPQYTEDYARMSVDRLGDLKQKEVTHVAVVHKALHRILALFTGRMAGAKIFKNIEKTDHYLKDLGMDYDKDVIDQIAVSSGFADEISDSEISYLNSRPEKTGIENGSPETGSGYFYTFCLLPFRTLFG